MTAPYGLAGPLMAGQQLPMQQHQAGPGMFSSDGMMNMLGDPRLGLALGLLSASRDRRINPYQAALQGAMSSAHFGRSMNAPKKMSAFEEKLRLMGFVPGTPEYKDAAKQLAMKPQNQTQIINPPAGYTSDPSNPGSMIAIPGGPADPRNPKNVTQDERTAKGYLERMQDAERRMGEVIATGFDPSAIWENVRGATNITATPEYRQYQQAQRDWVRAKLRKESGAVIAQEEMAAEVATYFPQPGDDAMTLVQKKVARQFAEKQMHIGAGALADDANTGWRIVR